MARGRPRHPITRSAIGPWTRVPTPDRPAGVPAQSQHFVFLGLSRPELVRHFAQPRPDGGREILESVRYVIDHHDATSLPTDDEKPGTCGRATCMPARTVPGAVTWPPAAAGAPSPDTPAVREARCPRSDAGTAGPAFVLFSPLPTRLIQIGCLELSATRNVRQGRTPSEAGRFRGSGSAYSSHGTDCLRANPWCPGPLDTRFRVRCRSGNQCSTDRRAMGRGTGRSSHDLHSKEPTTGPCRREERPCLLAEVDGPDRRPPGDGGTGSTCLALFAARRG